MKPEFPIYAIHSNGEKEIMETTEEIEMELEWFDTSDNDSIMIYDNQNRPVHLKVEALKLLIFELVKQ